MQNIKFQRDYVFNAMEDKKPMDWREDDVLDIILFRNRGAQRIKGKVKAISDEWFPATRTLLLVNEAILEGPKDTANVDKHLVLGVVVSKDGSYVMHIANVAEDPDVGVRLLPIEDGSYWFPVSKVFMWGLGPPLRVMTSDEGNKSTESKHKFSMATGNVAGFGTNTATTTGGGIGGGAGGFGGGGGGGGGAQPAAFGGGGGGGTQTAAFGGSGGHGINNAVGVFGGAISSGNSNAVGSFGGNDKNGNAVGAFGGTGIGGQGGGGGVGVFGGTSKIGGIPTPGAFNITASGQTSGVKQAFGGTTSADGTGLFGQKHGTGADGAKPSFGGTTADGTGLFGQQPGTGADAKHAFGGTTVDGKPQTGLFGQKPVMSADGAKPTFGGTTADGKPQTGLFGQTPTTSADGAKPAFGGTAADGKPQTGLFGQKPGTSADGVKSAFGGTATDGKQQTGLFGQKPVTSADGTKPAFGGTTAGGKPQAGLFGQTPATSVDGTRPAFGGTVDGKTQSGSFGQTPTSMQSYENSAYRILAYIQKIRRDDRLDIRMTMYPEYESKTEHKSFVVQHTPVTVGEQIRVDLGNGFTLYTSGTTDSEIFVSISAPDSTIYSVTSIESKSQLNHVDLTETIVKPGFYTADGRVTRELIEKYTNSRCQIMREEANNIDTKGKIVEMWLRKITSPQRFRSVAKIH